MLFQQQPLIYQYYLYVVNRVNVFHGIFYNFANLYNQTVYKILYLYIGVITSSQQDDLYEELLKSVEVNQTAKAQQ